MNLTLNRDTDNGVCTLGSMRINGVALQSLERPWIASLGSPGGVKGVSCVPAGTYRLVRHDSEAHPRSFALVNEELGVYHLTVPPEKSGRTACLIHVGNRVEEIRGCLILGMQRVRNGENWELRQSRVAVEKFYMAVPWIEGHSLTIDGTVKEAAP